MRISTALMQPLPLESTTPETIWFAPRSCVVVREDRRDVIAGGILVGSCRDEDVAKRNLLLVGLADEPDAHLGELARAFGLTFQGLWKLRRAHAEKGIAALLTRKRGGPRVAKVTPAVRKKLEKLFEEGKTAAEAHAALKANTLGRTTVWRERVAWAARQGGAIEAAPAEQPAATSAQGTLPGLDVPSPGSEAAPTELEAGGAPAIPTKDEEEERLAPKAVDDADDVQHLGTWLLLAMVQAQGMYRRAQAAAGKRVRGNSLRLALSAVVVALGLGERCIEGVRRLATSSAAALLLATRAPSPTWTRRTLGQFAAENGGAVFHLGMALEHLAQARADSSGPVFYVDNHMRPYTGMYTVRRGWRMQDKRVRPGASDYYLHDEDGRAVGRVTAPQHGSLTEFLTPIALMLRLALPHEAILLAFDRAGAFPSQMAELRDAGFEFVTYERRPYAQLAESEFTEEVVIDGERLQLCDSRKNLRNGRGRVRRICVLTEEGRQVNLVAVSKLPAKRLVEIMRGRWIQENAFKHGTERWGINQLDGRTVVPYSPDTVIPNPARRRLDEALRIARVREGLARSAVARLPRGDERRKELEQEVVAAVAAQQEFEALRPRTPTHAALKDTELAGKLVHHELEYKLTIDTIRIACANAESELALMLGPCLPRATEAKKTLANLFAAPGRIHVGRDVITVTLRPAGTAREMDAFEAMLGAVNREQLALPGDQTGRRLRFRIHQLS